MTLRTYICGILFFITAWGGTALACKSDMECKGSRICQAGVCTTPASGPISCSSDRDCPGDQICDQKQCKADSSSTSFIRTTQPVIAAPPAGGGQVIYMNGQALDGLAMHIGKNVLVSLTTGQTMVGMLAGATTDTVVLQIGANQKRLQQTGINQIKLSATNSIATVPSVIIATPVSEKSNNTTTSSNASGSTKKAPSKVTIFVGLGQVSCGDGECRGAEDGYGLRSALLFRLHKYFALGLDSHFGTINTQDESATISTNSAMVSARGIWENDKFFVSGGIGYGYYGIKLNDFTPEVTGSSFSGFKTVLEVAYKISQKYAVGLYYDSIGETEGTLESGDQSVESKYIGTDQFGINLAVMF